MNLIKTYKWHVVWIAVFCIFAFFRFENISYRVPFTWDHEQFSVQIRQIVVEHKLTLLGPRVTDDRGFFLAPYFTYLLIPFYLLTRLHPFALVYFLIAVNLIFFAVASVVVSRIIDKRAALIFLLLWSINPILVQYDTNPWWPVMIPLGTMIVVYLLYAIFTHKRLIYYVLLGISMGFFCNMHFQFVFVGIFAALFLCVSQGWAIVRNFFKLCCALGGFVVMFAPLMLFDMRHNFLNVHLFTTYFSERVLDDLPYPYAWQPVFANLMYPLTHIAHSLMSAVLLIMFLLMLIYLVYKKSHFERSLYISILGLLAVTAIGFSLYGRRPSEYYFVYLYPLLYLVLVDFFLTMKVYKVFAGIILFLICINAKDLYKTLEINPGGLYYKDQAIKTIIPYARNKRVNVSLDMPLGTNNGYMYLVEQNGIHQTGDQLDPLIELRIPPKKGDIVVHNIGIHIPKELK